VTVPGKLGGGAPRFFAEKMHELRLTDELQDGVRKFARIGRVAKE